MKITLSEIIKSGAMRAGLDETFAENFRLRLLDNKEILDEYVSYIKTGNFKCDYKVAGLSVSDVVVYQIDYFKAAMDQDRLDMKFNPDKMILMAFDTMLKMAADENVALQIKERIYSTSGTDGREMGTERIV